MFPIPANLKLIGIALIVLALAGLSWTSLHLYKRLSQEVVKCEKLRVEDAGKVSTATHEAQVRELESQIAAAERERDAVKQAQADADSRRAASDRAARTYRKELSDALAANSNLNRPLGDDVLARLCHAQADYDGSPREDCRH